jgi:amino acid adenylation domain-containing protein/thioester reductase-like protein
MIKVTDSAIFNIKEEVRTISKFYENMIDIITGGAINTKSITFIGRTYEKRIKYQIVYKKALAILNNLQKLGFEPSDQVIILIDKNEDFIYSVWACILGGITVVPLATLATPENIRMLLSVIMILEKPGMIISGEILTDLKNSMSENDAAILKSLENNMVLLEDIMNSSVLSEKIYRPHKNDIVAIMFSSGSTGYPKGVLQTHDNIVSAIEAAVRLHSITTADVFLGWLPLTHIIGVHLFHFVPLAAGADQIIMDKSEFVQNPLKWLQIAADNRATFLVSPNFGFQHFLRSFEKKQIGNWDLSCIRLILNGAEPVSIDIANEFTDKLSQFGLNKNAMCPSYGMTEATITISSYISSKGISPVKIQRESLTIGNKIIDSVEDNALSFVSLGTVVDNLEVNICDDNGQPFKSNTIGHIYIRGSSVTKGYYKNEEATKQAFTENGWFNTGDMGFIRDNELYITGREKDMAIFNGQNYYLNDIDRIVQELPEITKAAACLITVHALQQKEEILLAVRWVDSLESFLPCVFRIQNYLNMQLGISCSYIVPIEEIPCTQSGKVQRFRLSAMYNRGEFDDLISKIKSNQKEDNVETDISLSCTESKLARMWSTVLQKENINIKDNFFWLGGSSIQIMQLMQLIEEEFSFRLSYNQFIQNNNIAKLAKYINNLFDCTVNLGYEHSLAKKAIKNGAEMEDKADKDSFSIKGKIMDLEHLYEPFPLTSIQFAYLLGRNKSMELGGVGTHHYEEIRMELDTARFNNSLQKLIRRHPSLRILILENGTQRIMKDIPDYKIMVEDISHLSSFEIEEKIIQERQRMSHYVFLPGEWPYFEFKAFRLSSTDYYLFISIDLLILDAASLFYFSRELVQYYKNPDIELPEIKFTFRDYVISLNELTGSKFYKNSHAYWLDKLKKFPQAPMIPLKTSPVNIVKPHFKRKRKVFHTYAWSNLQMLAKEHNVTPSAILCTAYAEVLSYWSNQKELALNLTLFSRYPFHEDVTYILGDFTSLIILGLEMNSYVSFWQKVQYVQNITMEALEHRHYDGVDFIREYAKYNDVTARAVFPYVFSSIIFDGKSEGWNELGSSKMQLSQTSQVYLDNQLMDVEGQLYITWDYVEQLFEPELIDAMFEQYIQLINAIIVHNGYENNLFSKKYELEYQVYNLSAKELETSTLHGLFTWQVKNHGAKTAIIEGDESITYEELNRKSNQMAFYLLMQGIGRNSLAGVMAERKISTIVNILGILKAGAAYVPIDPKFPEKRKAHIISNSKCGIILRSDTYEKNNISECNADNHCIHFPSDMAYVIYTSGSTGKPKGVIITHESAVNTILDINTKFKVCEKDRILGVSSMCFDLSVYDIFATLATGAVLVMIPDQRDVFHLCKVVSDQQITIWNTVPAIMDMMLEYADNKVKNESLRLVMLSGDWIPLDLPVRIERVFSNARVISLGGATEASIWSIYFLIREINASWKSIPYGYPLANQQIYILNYYGQLCPAGVPGEIYIGGKGVAIGYCNDEIRTKESFVRHPQLGYLYKTGDFGVFNHGYIVFLGRKDNQVKIQGYRIELDEIQNRLLKHPIVKNAVITVFTDQQKGKQLCAYVVCKEEVPVQEFRNFLLKELPEYMIPVCFYFVDKIPLTSNGKLDSRSLPPPKQLQAKSTDVIRPKTDLERKLYDCWKAVLKVESISIKDKFFEIGGDSVKAIQLVNLLSKNFNVRINQIFESPTIEELAKKVTWKEGNLNEKIAKLKRKQTQINSSKSKARSLDIYKAYLSDANGYSCIDLSMKKNYQNILLTGATGYLGSYLFKELLENTEYKIYVTVRGCAIEEAQQRFNASVKEYFGEGFLTNYSERITVILADLTKEYLGMTPDSYDYYADNIHCIIHSAANVKHFGLLKDFKEVNVHGVEGLISFAYTGIKKDIHYISTNGLSMYDTIDFKMPLYTEEDIEFGQTYDNYYLQTKHEAEKILVKARKYGIDVNIYRAGVLVFASGSGRFQKNIEENAFYNNLKSYIKLGMVPDEAFEELEFSFVDYVSRAIILLFNKANLKNEVFHIYNHEKISFVEFAQLLKASSIDIRITGFDEFLDALSGLVDNKEVGVYAKDLLFTYYIYGNRSYLPEIVNDKTVTILNQLEFHWAKPNSYHISKMLEYCRQVEFI